MNRHLTSLQQARPVQTPAGPGSLGRWASLVVAILSAAILLAISGVWPMAMVAMIGVGLSQAMFMTLANTLVQEAVPDVVRGRVTSIFLMSAGGIMASATLSSPMAVRTKAVK